MNIYHFNTQLRSTAACIAIISDPITLRHAVNLNILSSTRKILPIFIRYANGVRVGMSDLDYYQKYYPHLPFIPLKSPTISTKD